MIKNPENRGSYSEEYDAPALQELLGLALRYVRHEELNEDVGSGKMIPDGSYSDFSCGVWEMFVNYGRRLLRNQP